MYSGDLTWLQHEGTGRNGRVTSNVHVNGETVAKYKCHLRIGDAASRVFIIHVCIPIEGGMDTHAHGPVATHDAPTSAFRCITPEDNRGMAIATNPSMSDALTATAVGPARPKTAGGHSRSRPTALQQAPESDTSRFHGVTSPSTRVLKATFSSSRVGLQQRDQFCTRFKSPRPRPPPATSSAMVTMASNGRTSRVRTPNASDKPLPAVSTATESFKDSAAIVGAVPMATSRGISHRVMDEEIETQRDVTRRAQRQFHDLQHALGEKKREIELVKRHLSAFEARTRPATSLDSASRSPVQSCTSTVSSTAMAALVAGAQVAGAGARHRESIAAAACLADGQEGDSSSQPVSIASRLKDQVQRQDLYKKKLRHLLDRLSRHLHFVAANLETLRTKSESAQRELALVRDRVLLERNYCTELEHKKRTQCELNTMHAHNATLVLTSLREEITSRATMSRRRHEADRRREQLLTLVQSSSVVRGGSTSASSARGSAAIVAAGRSEASRKNSVQELNADNAQHDNGTSTLSSADLVVRRRPSQSARHRSSSSVEVQQMVRQETFMQIYESQYARVLDATRETDMSVVLGRFLSFKETTRRLLQIEADATEQQALLERERDAHSDLVRKLRVAGIAESEKRKKIRDFLEQMHHVKAQVKSHAKDKFLDQLRVFSCALRGCCRASSFLHRWLTCDSFLISNALLVNSVDVQQGIENIVELFKCLDDRVSPPPAALASPLSSSSQPPIPSAARTVEDIVRFCVHVARANPGTASVVFTDVEVARVRDFVASDLRVSLPTRTAVEADERRSTAHNISKPADSRKEQTKATKEDVVEDDGDAMVSSESDTEETRRDMKRSEKDTLQQVEALLKTWEAVTLQQDGHPVDATSASTKKLTRSGGRHGSARTVPAPDDALGIDMASLLGHPATAGDGGARAARLEAVHAFFREKRRRERLEHQQQRKMLTLLAEAAYSSPHSSSDDHGSSSHVRHSPSRGAGEEVAVSSSGGGPASPTRSKLVSTMARKRSNGVAALLLHSAVQEKQRQTGAQRSLRPKTVR